MRIGRAAGGRGQDSSPMAFAPQQPRLPWRRQGSFSAHPYCWTDSPPVPRPALRTAHLLPSWVALPAPLGSSLLAGDSPLCISSPGVPPSWLAAAQAAVVPPVTARPASVPSLHDCALALSVVCVHLGSLISSVLLFVILGCSGPSVPTL